MCAQHPYLVFTQFIHDSMCQNQKYPKGVNLDMRYPRVANMLYMNDEYTTFYAFTFASLGNKNSWTEQLGRKWSIPTLVVILFYYY